MIARGTVPRTRRTYTADRPIVRFTNSSTPYNLAIHGASAI